MKTKSAFTSICIMLVLLNSTYAQLVIDGNSWFWDNTSIKNKYIITLDHPEVYSLVFEERPGMTDCYSGRKNYDFRGKPGLEFLFEMYLHRGFTGSEYIADSKYKPGDFDFDVSLPNQKEDDGYYGLDDLFFVIEKQYLLAFRCTIRFRHDVDVFSDDYDEDLRLKDKIFRKATEELKMFLLENLKIEKIGDLSPEENTATSQTDASGQVVDGNLDTATWVKVVGGAAALAVAMTLVAKIFKARRRKSAGKPNQPQPKKENKQQKEKKEEEEEKFFYILQLNKDLLEIGPEKTDKLVITAWRVDSAGNRSLAKDAAIQVQTLEKGIAISSPSGKGQCASELSLQSEGQFNDAILTISAAVGGKILKATAKVTCNQQLTLIVDAPAPLTFINGKKYQEALYEQQKDETDGEWVFKPFCLWFTDDPNPTIDPDRTKPVKPPFNPIFKIEAIPDVLEISTPVHHGENVWKADVKLFAGKSVDTNWLFNDGKIKITVTVDEQKLNVK